MEAGDTTRNLVLFVGREGVSGLEIFPFSLFVSNKYPLSFFTTRHERKVGLPYPHGEFVHQKSPAATNSSIAHEQKDMNEVEDRAHTGRHATVFFEFALFENLSG